MQVKDELVQRFRTRPALTGRRPQIPVPTRYRGGVPSGRKLARGWRP